MNSTPLPELTPAYLDERLEGIDSTLRDLSAALAEYHAGDLSQFPTMERPKSSGKHGPREKYSIHEVEGRKYYFPISARIAEKLAIQQTTALKKLVEQKQYDYAVVALAIVERFLAWAWQALWTIQREISNADKQHAGEMKGLNNAKYRRIVETAWDDLVSSGARVKQEAFAMEMVDLLKSQFDISFKRSTIGSWVRDYKKRKAKA